MNTTIRTLAQSVSALIMAFWMQAQAGQSRPAAYSYHVVPPGTWQELFVIDSDGQSGPGRPGNEISAFGPDQATLSGYYTFEGATLLSVTKGVPDTRHPVASWDYVTTYTGGTLTLTNVPGAPWYNKRDPSLTFVYPNIIVTNLTRSSRYAGTLDEGRIDFDLTGIGENVIIHATFSGYPMEAYDGPGMCGELDSAEITVSK
jgi:hypothetical protein